jgi:hypothetical protein
LCFPAPGLISTVLELDQPLSRNAGEGAEHSEAGEGQWQTGTLGDCAATQPKPNGVFGRPCGTGFRFRRQHPVRGFILDFACTRHRLAVEADGGQHVDSQADDTRTAVLEKDGWRVLRFWNNDILTNTESVIEAIFQALAETTRPGTQAAPATTLSRGAGEGL